MLELKKYRGVMCDDTDNWCKIWKKTDPHFQKWHDEFSRFSSEHVRKFKNCDFDGILLPKVENARALNLQRSFVSWKWRMIWILKRNWPISSKLTRIWWIVTRGLKTSKRCSLMGCFWPKYIIFVLKRIDYYK